MRVLILLFLCSSSASAWTLVDTSEGDCLAVLSHRVTLDVGPRTATAVTEIVLDIGAADLEVLVPRVAAGEVRAWADGHPLQVETMGADEVTDALVARASERSRPTLVSVAGRPASVIRYRAARPQTLRIESTPLVERGAPMPHIMVPLRTLGTFCAPVPVEVEATVRTADGLGAVFAPFHDLQIERPDANTARFVFVGDDHHDLHLYLASSAAEVAANAITWRAPACEEAPRAGYVLVAAGPTSLERDDAVAKDVVLVIDRSGSMAGEKTEQVKRALHAILGGLGPADRFDLITFAGDVRASFGRLEEAEDGRVEAARRVVDGIAADGSTDIHGALLAALAMVNQGSHDRPRMVVFLTDGQATAGVTDNEAILADVEAANELGVRVFTFGVGDRVNTRLLDELGRRTNAATHYIRPGDDIDAALVDFYREIQAPVFTDVTLEARGVTLDDVLPRALPDLFIGSQLLVTGRYGEGSSASLSLEGRAAGGETAFEVRGDIVARGEAHAFLPRLWASRRMAELLYEARQAPDDEALIAEIKALAWRHGFATRFTRFSEGQDGRVAAGYDNPTGDEVGDEAVGTSSDINEMSGNSNADAYSQGDGPVQMVQVLDRTLVREGATWRDTTVPIGAPTIDIELWSDDWRRLVDAGAGPLLAVGREVVFGWRCHTVRIFDGAGEAPLTPDPLPPAAAERAPAPQVMGEAPPPVPARPRAQGCAAGGEPAAPWAIIALLALSRRRRAV